MGTEPNWIDYGEHGDYCYFQSDIPFLDALIECCPEVFLNKWALVSTVKYQKVPLDTATSPILGIDDEISIYGDGDEMYFFDYEVKVQDLQVLKDTQDLYTPRLSEADPKIFQFDWQRLDAVNACALISWGDIVLFIFKDKTVARKFQDSDFYRKIPTLHLTYLNNWEQRWLLQDTVPEKCAQSECNENRVKFGVNCPKHHCKMMTGYDL